MVTSNYCPSPSPLKCLVARSLAMPGWVWCIMGKRRSLTVGDTDKWTLNTEGTYNRPVSVHLSLDTSILVAYIGVDGSSKRPRGIAMSTRPQHSHPSHTVMMMMMMNVFMPWDPWCRRTVTAWWCIEASSGADVRTSDISPSSCPLYCIPQTSTMLLLHGETSCAPRNHILRIQVPTAYVRRKFWVTPAKKDTVSYYRPTIRLSYVLLK